MIPGDPRCPACDAVLDDATDVDLTDHRPEPGDATVCAYCRAWLVFTPATGRPGLALRYPTDEELGQMARNPRVLLARDVVREVIRRRGSG